jgi:hypothetical protein
MPLMLIPKFLILVCPFWVYVMVCRYISEPCLTSQIHHLKQEITWQLQGQVGKCDHREYGKAQLQMTHVVGETTVDALFEGLGDEMQVCQLSLLHE